MTDKLKQFIDSHREEFDSLEPSTQLIKKLRSSRDPQAMAKKYHYRKLLRWAAAVAGLIILSATVYLMQKEPVQNADISRQPPVDVEDVTGVTDPIYANQIYHFQELIGLKQEELKQLKKEYPELYNQFVSDITELDSAYQSLKTNMAKNPNREMLLEAMIQNLQLQSDLLNQQLLIIKEIKQKTRSHEKNSI